MGVGGAPRGLGDGLMWLRLMSGSGLRLRTQAWVRSVADLVCEAPMVVVVDGLPVWSAMKGLVSDVGMGWTC